LDDEIPSLADQTSHHLLVVSTHLKFLVVICDHYPISMAENRFAFTTDRFTIVIHPSTSMAVASTPIFFAAILVGGIPTPLKNMSSPVGMMKFPIYGKKNMFQTTNQL